LARHGNYSGLVEPNKPVNLVAVIAANEYWTPPVEPGSAWLYEGVLPLVRSFFAEHKDHGIVYVESGDFFGIDDFEPWDEIE
jgi:hypothetical protein